MIPQALYSPGLDIPHPWSREQQQHATCGHQGAPWTTMPGKTGSTQDPTPGTL